MEAQTDYCWLCERPQVCVSLYCCAIPMVLQLRTVCVYAEVFFSVLNPEIVDSI